VVRLAWLALALAVLAGAGRAEEWPMWRGPRGDGTSTETGVPVRWSADENVAWKAPVPGKGHSSPIVWGDRVFVTTCVEAEKKRMLLCFDRRDGKRLWDRVVLTAALEKKNDLNSYASGTPATDGRRVYVSFLDFPHILVAAYDMDGGQAWRCSPGELHSVHGFCSSLILYKDIVILNADQDARAFIVALDRATGEERWRADRPNRVRSYCPPFVAEAGGRTQMVLAGSKCVASYDPDTGKQIWIVDGPTDQFVASMVFTDGLFCITGGYPSLHVLGIRPDGEGNVTGTHVTWHARKDPSYVPSPVAAGRWFFVVSDAGVLSCIEAKTGRYVWQEKIARHVFPSPVSAGGNLYFLDDDGVTTVLKPGPAPETVARNAVGEECRASPAVSRGQIFIRGLKNLYCIGAAKGEAK
jgi:hypothetical protein